MAKGDEGAGLRGAAERAVADVVRQLAAAAAATAAGAAAPAPDTRPRSLPAPGTPGGPATPPKNLDGLCDLIAQHNPYTAGNVEDMDIHTRPPSPDNHPYGGIEIEQDAGYPGDWSFKGQVQKVNKVLKVKYRAAIHKKDQHGYPTNEVDYWMTAYLLIGYEDGGP